MDKYKLHGILEGRWWTSDVSQSFDEALCDMHVLKRHGFNVGIEAVCALNERTDNENR
jgi:hypothetical protein